jgi:DNA-binding transcriptional MocR family regulator
MARNDELLYIRVANSIEQLIETDVIRVGEKVPSVRKLSEEQGISMSTVFQAYYHLENKGLIEARPKSGYFVKYCRKQMPDLPQQSNPSPVARNVSVDEMVASVFKYATAPGILPLSMASPGLELLPGARLNKAVVEAMRQSRGQYLNYDEPMGNTRLREQIALKSFDWGGTVSPDDIIVTNGCMEALCLSLKAVTKPGDTVAVESPTYFGVLQAIESMGLKTVELPTDPQTGLMLEVLEDMVNRNKISVCLFMPNYNNPIGSCMPDENKKALVEMLAKKEIPLIEDDIYGELHYGAYRPRTCKTYDRHGLVILCSSFSKTLAPGFRLGWVIPGRFREKVLRQKLMNTIATNTLVQAATASFLENGRYDNHLKKLRRALQTQMLRYTHAISEFFPPDTRVTQPEGGFVLWLELNRKIDAFELFNRALDHKISIAPGNIFSAQGRYRNCIRISCGHPWNDEYEQAMATIGRLTAEISAEA